MSTNDFKMMVKGRLPHDKNTTNKYQAPPIYEQSREYYTSHSHENMFKSGYSSQFMGLNSLDQSAFVKGAGALNYNDDNKDEAEDMLAMPCSGNNSPKL